MLEKLPDSIQALRLLAAFLITAGLGVHAFHQHKQEAVEAVSPRKWMYWIYSVVFLVASAACFTQLCVTVVFRDYTRAPFHLGFSTLLLVLSYVALLAGTKRRTFE